MPPSDPDAWWSPVPGAPAPDALAAPTTASDPGYRQLWRGADPYALPNASAARPVARRWPGVVGWTTPFLLVVCSVLAVTLGPSETRTLMDESGTVSIAVPRSWYDDTGTLGSGPDEPSVLAASNLWQSRWVEVDRFDVDDDDSLQSFHADGIDHECASRRCTGRTGPQALAVAGHDALEQVLTHPGDADTGATRSLTLTVWLDDEVVELYTEATATGDTPPAVAPLEAIAASLRLG